MQKYLPAFGNIFTLNLIKHHFPILINLFLQGCILLEDFLVFGGLLTHLDFEQGDFCGPLLQLSQNHDLLLVELDSLRDHRERPEILSNRWLVDLTLRKFTVYFFYVAARTISRRDTSAHQSYVEVVYLLAK